MENQSNGQMSVNDLLGEAEQAHQKGVPVDWRQLAYTVANVANNYIANLEEPTEAQQTAHEALTGLGGDDG